MGDQHLGEFEHLVMLAILRLGDEAYGAPIRRTIEDRAERPVSLGAVYSTLRRLQSKRYVEFESASAGQAAGGRPRRIFHVTETGAAALDSARRRLSRMAEGIAAYGEARR